MLSIFGNGAEERYEEEIGNGRLDIEESRGEYYLSKGEIREFLNEFRDSMPSFLIRELEHALEGKNITRAQLIRIMEKIVTNYLDRDSGIRRSVSELSNKLEDVQKEISELKLYSNEIQRILAEIEELRRGMTEIREAIDDLMRDIKLLYSYDRDLGSFIEEVLRGCDDGGRDTGDNQD